MNKSIFKYLCGIAAILMVMQSCQKDVHIADVGPYYPPVIPLVKFLNEKPSPEHGRVGDEVTFKVIGLNKLDSFQFLINQIPAQIVTKTDSLIVVKIPNNASSGAGTILTNKGQYFFGPLFRVDGLVGIDPSFEAGAGANAAINDITAGSGSYNIVGDFTDFDGKASAFPVNHIGLISRDGAYQSPYRGAYPDLMAEDGASGSISSIVPVSGGQFIIGGVFGMYNKHSVGNITKINSNRSLDTTFYDLINPDPDKHPENNRDTVARFNGELSGGRGGVVKLFVDPNNNNNVIALGNFGIYSTIFYPRSQKDVKVIDRTKISFFARMSLDGKLDSTYNFNMATGEGYKGLNGNLIAAIQLANGKIIFVGSFTSFNDNPANRIAALNNDGSQDMSFASTVGNGADGDIYTITYNSNTHKILITGQFKNYDGHPADGVAMLNEDGSFDTSFQLGKIEGGAVNYAGQLNNGLIMVSGTFTTYDDIVRQGFMILNSDGSLAYGYNNTGAFAGQIKGFVESTSIEGVPYVMLYGRISVFDNTNVGNIVRIIVIQP